MFQLREVHKLGVRPNVASGRGEILVPTATLTGFLYSSARSISEICIRQCEPVHIDPARLVPPPSSGALQRRREKCVPSFLPPSPPATIFATGVTPVAASEYRYCLQGDDFAGAGDCEFTSYQQCQATAAGRTANPYLAAANPYLANAAVLTIPAKPRRR